MPLGYFYSPFLPEAQAIKASPLLCAKCKASINSWSNKNRNTKTWTCNFCLTNNPMMQDIGIQQIEEYVQTKAGNSGLFFVIDTCVSKPEFEAVKETLLKMVDQLPNNIYVGLLSFNRNAFLFDF